MISVENTNVVFDMNERLTIFQPVVFICQPETEKETDDKEQEQS